MIGVLPWSVCHPVPGDDVSSPRLKHVIQQPVGFYFRHCNQQHIFIQGDSRCKRRRSLEGIVRGMAVDTKKKKKQRPRAT